MCDAILECTGFTKELNPDSAKLGLTENVDNTTKVSFESVTIRIDPVVISWFIERGPYTLQEYQADVNFRRYMFQNVLESGTCSNLSLRDIAFEHESDVSFNIDQNFMSLVFYEVEVSHENNIPVKNWHRMGSLARLVGGNETASDGAVPRQSVLSGVQVKPLSGPGFDRLIEVFGCSRKKGHEGIVPTLAEIADFFDSFKKYDFKSVAGFKSFIKDRQIAFEVEDRDGMADVIEINRSFNQFICAFQPVRPGINDGQHRLKPLMCTALGFAEPSDSFPLEIARHRVIPEEDKKREKMIIFKKTCFQLCAPMSSANQLDMRTICELWKSVGRERTAHQTTHIDCSYSDHITDSCSMALDTNDIRDLSPMDLFNGEGEFANVIRFIIFIISYIFLPPSLRR